jgi:hypothetical protein
MKLVLLFLTLLPLAMLNAQPMSGNYTVGGTSPDFATLQDAADALKRRGVSGPVFFNIRPGVYERNGGNNTVLRLDTLVAGVSAANRITFQPDAASGGHVDNVIPQFNRTNPSTADRDLVRIQLDFVTLRNLTLQEIDSSRFFNTHLVRLDAQPLNRNPTVDGFVLEGCKLLGTPHLRPNFRGTNNGIGSRLVGSELTIRGNTFARFLEAIDVGEGTVVQATITIEDNHILEGYWSSSGTGNALGAGIQIACTTAIARRNTVDFTNSITGGFRGIVVDRPRTAVVEQNLIAGPSERGMVLSDFTGTASDSVLIANNMIVGGSIIAFTGAPTNQFALSSTVRNARIVFNTIVVPGGGGTTRGLTVTGSNATVLNNLILNYGSGFAIALNYGSATQAANLRSDYNVIYRQSTGSGYLVMRNGVSYTNLALYQGATGLDSNSVSMSVDLLNLVSDLHLSGCQAQHPDLAGLPLQEITEDFDGDIRSLTTPLRGADEVAQRAVPMFGDVFKIPVPGFITDIAAGAYDNLLFAEGLAIADWTNSQVRLYHNNPSTRSFTLSQILSPGFQPTHVKFFDLDRDGNLDVVVAGNTVTGGGEVLGLIRVYWGDGGGGFPSDSTYAVGYLLSPGVFFSLGRGLD